MAGWGLEWNLVVHPVRKRTMRIAFGEKPPGAAVVPGGFQYHIEESFMSRRFPMANPSNFPLYILKLK